ncbi:hypothetical protein [Abyssalbus ytuae]|uniref:Uncharacterized protein n=1 Tax=Abyssalbus ytuae TaxID=2926907 RepID=A0A9E6ZML2_9FLAO|nr:hypothetical protein [Abyssalbus ytuae]UOB18602.1 hypothetical protein MQE35_04760 [Abyssalbus ytuae]
MKELLFKVINKKKIDNKFTLEEIHRFPNHELTQYELNESIVKVEYEPTSQFNEIMFIEFMIKHLKKWRKAYSVEHIDFVNKQISN